MFFPEQLGKRKIGFFGGTFDPIHFGHINLALRLGEAAGLDEILFSPAYISPTKQQDLPTADGQARKEMVELALEDLPNARCFDWEISREGPSYTIDVIRHLVACYPEATFYLILGKDAVEGLLDWKEVEELLTLTNPLIGGRPGGTNQKFPPQLKEMLQGKEVEIPTMEISSTEIRERLASNKYCHHLVPAKVLDYIATHRLYLRD